MVTRVINRFSTLPHTSFPKFHFNCRSMTTTTAPPIIVPPGKDHRATVVFLHGLGDQGDGWSDVFKYEIRNKHIKYIFPNSPIRPVTVNGGALMPAWFDRFGYGEGFPEDEKGIDEAAANIQKILDDEISSTGIPSEKIILGGFSMGGSVALYSALTYKPTLAGIIVMSSKIVRKHRKPETNVHNLTTPIFLAHGAEDTLVEPKWAKLTEEIVQKFNPTVKLRMYENMEHSSCSQELSDLQDFINERLNL